MPRTSARSKSRQAQRQAAKAEADRKANAAKAKAAHEAKKRRWLRWFHDQMSTFCTFVLIPVRDSNGHNYMFGEVDSVKLVDGKYKYIIDVLHHRDTWFEMTFDGPLGRGIIPLLYVWHLFDGDYHTMARLAQTAFNRAFHDCIQFNTYARPPKQGQPVRCRDGAECRDERTGHCIYFTHV